MKTLILGYYGAKNLGDDMMLDGILDWLGPQNRVCTVISEDPEDTQRRFNVSAVKNTALLLQWGWYATIFKKRGYNLVKAFWNTDELVVGGGDLIRDKNGWKNFFYTVEKIILAQLFGKNTHLINVGIQTPTRLYSRFILRKLLQRCSTVIVRDRRTLNYCKSINLNNVTLAPDIAINLHNKYQPKTEWAHPENKYCVLTMRANPNLYKGFDISEHHYKTLAAILENFCKTQTLKLVCVPFQSIKGSDDNTDHEKIKKHFKNQNLIEIKEWNPNIGENIKILSDAEIVIGMRLHTVVIGASCDTPTVALPYDQKLEEFCEYAGITTIIRPKDLTSTESTTKILIAALESKSNAKALDTEIWQTLSLRTIGGKHGLTKE